MKAVIKYSANSKPFGFSPKTKKSGKANKTKPNNVKHPASDSRSKYRMKILFVYSKLLFRLSSPLMAS